MVHAHKAVLFDVDGTLCRAHGSGREALARAASVVFGLELERARREAAAIDFRGNTDALINAELCARLGVEERTDDLVAHYLVELETLLGERGVVALPGVVELVSGLRHRPMTQIGLITGNVRQAARMKVERIGLGFLAEHPGGFAEDGRERQELVGAALERLAALGIKPWGVLVVGDTPRDVEAAHHWGAPAVAVATGFSSWEELEGAAPELLVRDLADPGPLLRLLESL